MYTSIYIYIHIQREKNIYIYRCIKFCVYIYIKKKPPQDLCSRPEDSVKKPEKHIEMYTHSFIRWWMWNVYIYNQNLFLKYMYIYINTKNDYFFSVYIYIYIYLYIYVHTRILRTSNLARRLSMRSHHSVYVIPNSLKLREQKLLNW